VPALEEIGVVLATDGGRASVRMDRRTACETCGRCGLAALSKSEDIVVTAKNPAGAGPGDRVIVEMEGKAVLSAAFFVFVLPLLLAGFGYVLGGTVAALLLFALSFVAIRVYDRRVEKSGRLDPTIVMVVEQE
jgi:sigma-E factor negative regulatory protein RseC